MSTDIDAILEEFGIVNGIAAPNDVGSIPGMSPAFSTDSGLANEFDQDFFWGKDESIPHDPSSDTFYGMDEFDMDFGDDSSTGQESTSNDIDNTTISKSSQSPRNSTTLDHSYSLISGSDSISEEPPATSGPKLKSKAVKRRNERDESSSVFRTPAPKKKNFDSPITFNRTSEDSFTYQDENGKVVTVERTRKNAEMAKLNRLRKKRYLSNLESEVRALRQQNMKLMEGKEETNRIIEGLKEEVQYFKAVLAEKTTLMSLVSAVSTVPGVPVTKTGSNTMTVAQQHLPDSTYSGGICLHVSSGKVALQMCAHCSRDNS